MKGEEQGLSIAFYLAEALYRLGFPWDKVGDEGLKIVERFTSEEVEVETDKGILKGMRDHFEKIKSDPPDIPPMTFDSHLSPSEYVVLDDLIRSLEDLAGHLPWVAAPIYDILDDYNEYLESVNASEKLQERSGRLRHSISDLEDRAAGRG